MQHRIERDRLHAVLALRHETFLTLAHDLDVSCVHLRHVLGGTRAPSQNLAMAIERVLGDALPFVAGHVDVLDVRCVASPTNRPRRRSINP